MEITDLLEELTMCYNNRIMFKGMNNCVNWSALCDKSKYIIPMNNIMSFRFFKFNRDKESMAVAFFVRATAHNVWKPKSNGKRNDLHGFLPSTQNLRLRPLEFLNGLQYLEKVTARIFSEKSRINSTAKLPELLQF